MIALTQTWGIMDNLNELAGNSGESEDAANSASESKAVDIIQSAISWAYATALDGLPGMGTVDDLVTSYLHEGNTAEDAISSLIAWQVGKAATAGFVTGLGGIITLPAAIPANLASVLYIQLRMIAAIAKMRGYDIHSDQVKTLCIACLAGSAVADVLKDVGIKVGAKLTQQAISRIAGSTLVRINQAVGFRLVTKAGQTGIFNLTKMVPFLGGLVGGSFDAVTTRTIAQAAKTVFVPYSPGDSEEVSQS
jgi:uncharacterized protein (DUF697 family)